MPLVQEEVVVDFTPESFSRETKRLTCLLADQIDRFWPSSGFNMLLDDDDDDIQGFFDGNFLFAFEVNRDKTTFNVSTLVYQHKETTTASIRQKIVERVEELRFEMVNADIQLHWSGDGELTMSITKLDMSLVHKENLKKFEAVINPVIDEAHRVSKVIKQCKKKAKSSQSGNTSSIIRRVFLGKKSKKKK